MNNLIVVSTGAMVLAFAFANSPVNAQQGFPQQKSDSVRLEWARQWGSRELPNTDMMVDAAVDESGNSYVCGYDIDEFSGQDIVTVMYDRFGNTRWLARYSVASAHYSYPQRMKVDGKNNVYVAGMSDYVGTGEDLLVIKYDSAGYMTWAATYNDPNNRYDDPADIAIDGEGNVYVTGTIGPPPGFFDSDIVTLKYNSSGVRQWAVTYAGSGGNRDVAQAIGVDSAGNVYVTGTTSNLGTASDITTIKYNPAGSRQWVSTYNGAGSPDDVALGLALDRGGSSYVLGNSQGECLVLKYNAEGAQQWLAHAFSGSGRKLVLAYSGDLVVVGDSADRDIITRLKSDGTRVWTDAGTDGSMFGIDLDSAGNAYVCGTADGDYITTKYTPSGAKEWIRRYNGPRGLIDIAFVIAVDKRGNVAVAGASSGEGMAVDLATVRYDAAGSEAWTRRYSGPPHSMDQDARLVLDRLGNVCITGNSAATNPFYPPFDYGTLKYDPTGNVQWVARYHVPEGDGNNTRGIAADRMGNVFVTGDLYFRDRPTEMGTVKYDPAGMEMWSVRYGNNTGLSYSAIGVGVDQQGNVYVAANSSLSASKPEVDASHRPHSSSLWFGSPPVKVGFSENARSSGISSLILKYDLQGKLQWVSGPPHGDSQSWIRNMVVDNAGNTYFVGTTSDTTAEDNYFAAQYDSAGQLKWTCQITRPCCGDDYSIGLAIDSIGNVYMTGNIHSDILTAKISRNGVVQWTSSYNGPANRDDKGRAIAVDDHGNVFVTGQSMGASSEYEFLTIRYDSLGHEQWVVREAGPSYEDGNPMSIALDKAGDVYIAGQCRVDTLRWYDITTIKYSSSGERQWMAQHNCVTGWDDYGTSVCVDGTGNVYVGGYSIGSYTAFYAVLKYSQHISSVEGDGLSVPEKYVLSQNYPNPFNPTTKIGFGVTGYGLVSLKVYDVLGREVATLVNEVKLPGTYTAQWNASNVASGVYFYRLKAGEFVQTRNLVLLR